MKNWFNPSPKAVGSNPTPNKILGASLAFLAILFITLLIPKAMSLGLVYDGPNPIIFDLRKGKGPFIVNFIVTNPSDEPEVVWFRVIGIGANTSFVDNWAVSFSPSNFTLAPSESRSVQMVATPKPNAPLGRYEGCLLINTWNPERPYDEMDGQFLIRMFAIKVSILVVPEFHNIFPIFLLAVLLATVLFILRKRGNSRKVDHGPPLLLYCTVAKEGFRDLIAKMNIFQN